MPFKTDKQRKAFFASKGNNNNSKPIILSKGNFRTQFKEMNKRGISLVSINPKEDKARKNLEANFIAVSKTGKKTPIFTNNKKDAKAFASAIFGGKGGKLIEKRFKSNKDSDGDGVPDHKDCRPFDPKKQGKLHDLAINVLRKKEEFVERRREAKMRKLEDLKDKLRERKALLSSRQGVLKQKQEIINETLREKKQIRDLKTANAEAAAELRRTSGFGRFVAGTIKAGKKSAEVLKKTQKALKKFN